MPPTDPHRGPQHVAVIMDGNGRWATARGLPRAYGHRKGLEALRAFVRLVVQRGIRVLTLYSFSSENWSRPPDEVAGLMDLLRLFIRNDLAELHAAHVRVRVIGGRDDLDPSIATLLADAEALTRANTGLVLVIAFNYGGRQEIVRAVRRLAEAAAEGRLTPEAITEVQVAEALDTAGLPDPDLVIRTSGEQRLSNFLPWQSAYAEFVFLPVLWPDFDERWLETALADYARRQRRFGGTVERTSA